MYDYDDDFEDDDYDDDYDDEDEDDYDDDEDDDDEDDNEDGYGSDEDNPDGYGQDPEPEDDEQLKDDDEDKKKKKTKGDKGGDESVKGEVNAEGKGPGKGKLDTVKMNKMAKTYHCGPRTKYDCPFCKQRSIYYEPPVSSMIRAAIWYCGGMDRDPRYVCLNPKCKACFKPGAPSARFKVSETGVLKTTHGFHTPQNPLSFRSVK